MCGIYFDFRATDSTHEILREDQPPISWLRDRGPDFAKLCSYKSIDKFNVVAYATVLGLRGEAIVPQPLSSGDLDDDECSLLFWNGEAWSIDDVPPKGNDAIAVFDLLIRASKEDFTAENSQKKTAVAGIEHHFRHDLYGTTIECQVSIALAKISGPFAFVFKDGLNNRVFFGRDCFGRRSLLMKSTPDSLTISSIAPPNADSEWKEVTADGIHILEFRPNNVATSIKGNELRSDFILQQPILDSEALLLSHYHYGAYGKYSILNRTLPQTTTHSLTPQPHAVEQLERLLRASIYPRVQNILLRETDSTFEIEKQPIIAILFSGGLDCTILARLLHDALPFATSVDLLNVAFENPRIHGIQKGRVDCEQSELDSACYDQCPDRVTGRASHSELQKICPQRQWTFVEINIPYSESQSHREKVKALIFPHNTEMDLSIGYALYFASRGVGQVFSLSHETYRPYHSTARVLLSGLGADELFGGYQRHATAFTRLGYGGLLDELELDINRLGKRNLGRDDRVISSWGKEARYPYLDEPLVTWSVLAPVWEKCGFGQTVPPGSDSDEVPSESLVITGCQTENVAPEHCGEVDICTTLKSLKLSPDKLILRLLAQKLGMIKVAREKKRAIQFGARTAKMQTGKIKGTTLIS